MNYIARRAMSKFYVMLCYATSLLTGAETDILRANMIAEITTSVERQLSSMEYFGDDADENDLLQFAPLTNLGCESEVAALDVRLKVSGGTTSIQTLSNKTVVKTNKYLDHKDLLGLSPGERKLVWRAARTGDDALQVHALLRDFTAKVGLAREAMVDRRKGAKKKKALRLVKLIGECKEHGGPVERKTVNIVDGLNEKQVLAEMSVLRALGSDVKSKRKVQGNGKSFFQTFGLPQLKETVRQAVAPTNDVDLSVEELLQSVAFKASSFKIGDRVQKGFWDDKASKMKMYKGKVSKLYTHGPLEGDYFIEYDDGDTESVLLAEIEYMLCVL